MDLLLLRARNALQGVQDCVGQTITEIVGHDRYADLLFSLDVALCGGATYCSTNVAPKTKG